MNPKKSLSPKKLARRLLPGRGVRLAEEAYRRGRIYGLQARYGFPARGLKIVAVTGTNGKTTTCCFVNAILKAAGRKTALYSTAVVEIAGRSEPNTTHRTLPLTTQLLRFLRRAQQAGCEYVVLEVTSHALHQHKLRGIPVEVAIMTNLTQDHLDYHGTMQKYAAAKARLFNAYMNPVHCVLNADDDWYDYFLLQAVGQVVSYGRGPDSACRISQVKPAGDAISWRLDCGSRKLELRSRLPGLFNAYNASAAAAAGLALGLPAAAIVSGIGQLTGVPGRAEPIKAGQPFDVWVDYAVTPDALEKVLQAARQAASGRVLVVFGATGERDRAKRPLMGKVAVEQADLIYLTDDETYGEDPDAIRRAVYEGVVAAGGRSKAKVITERRAAIRAAFAAAKKGDVVVLAGLGHQDSRNLGGRLVPWDERRIARQLLRRLGARTVAG